MGNAVRGDGRARRAVGGRVGRAFGGALALLVAAGGAARAQAPRATEATARLARGRFAVVFAPADRRLAASLLDAALANDSFPWLPRPRATVRLEVAPSRAAFRRAVGAGAPEWGAAFAFPGDGRVVLQGAGAGAEAGDPLRVLRHELAHLALHEALGEGIPRWLDEGYASVAAGEWDRDDVLATNLVLAWRGVPSLAALDSGFAAGASRADGAYALAYRAVTELAQLDERRGLALLFAAWREAGDFERALRRAHGLTASGFEALFRTRTRRRYGGVAVLADATLGSLLVVLVVLPFAVARRRRDAARLAALRAADAAEAAAGPTTLDAMLATPATSEGDARPPVPT